MRDRIAGTLWRGALVAATLAGSGALAGCSLFGPSKFDVLRAYTTVTDGISAAFQGAASSTNPGSSPPTVAGTYDYTSPDGSVEASIMWINEGTSSAPDFVPTGGSILFSGYSDSSHTYSVSGTLSFTVNVTAGSGTNTAPVNLDGNLSLSGGTISTLDCTLAATGSPTLSWPSGVTVFGYSGTLVANGQSFNIDDLYK